MSDKIEHDAASSRRYKEDLDGVWPQITALEAEVARLRGILDRALDLIDRSPYVYVAERLRKEVDGD